MGKSFALFVIFCFVLFEQTSSETQNFDCTTSSHPFFTPFCSDTFYRDCNSFIVPQEFSPITNTSSAGVCSSSTRSGYYGITFETTGSDVDSYYYTYCSATGKTVVFNFKLYDDCPLARDLPILSSSAFIGEYNSQIIEMGGIADYFDTSYQYLFSMNLNFSFEELGTTFGSFPPVNLTLRADDFDIQTWQLDASDLGTYILYPTIPNLFAYNNFFLKNNGNNTQLFFLNDIPKFSSFTLDLSYDPNFFNLGIISYTFSIIPVISLIRWETDNTVTFCVFLKDNQFQFFAVAAEFIPFGEPVTVLPNLWYTFGFTSEKIDNFDFQYTIAIMEENFLGRKEFQYFGISSGREIVSYSGSLLWRIGPINGLLDNIDFYDSIIFTNETFAEYYPALSAPASIPPFNLNPNRQICSNDQLVYISFEEDLPSSDGFGATYLCYDRDCTTTISGGSQDNYGYSSFEPNYSQGVNIELLPEPLSLPAYSILFYYQQTHFGVYEDCDINRSFPALIYHSYSASLNTDSIAADFTHSVYLTLEIDFVLSPHNGDSVNVTLMYNSRSTITVAGWIMGTDGYFKIYDPNFAVIGQLSSNIQTIILLPFVTLTLPSYQIQVDVATESAYSITLRVVKTTSYLRLENDQGFPLFAVFNDNRFIYNNNAFITESCLTQADDLNTEWSGMLFTNTDDNTGTLYYDCSDNFSSFSSQQAGKFMSEVPTNIRIGPVNGYIDQIYLFEGVVTDSTVIDQFLYCISPEPSHTPAISLAASASSIPSVVFRSSSPSVFSSSSPSVTSSSSPSVTSSSSPSFSQDSVPLSSPTPSTSSAPSTSSPSPSFIPSLQPSTSTSSSSSISMSISLSPSNSPAIPAAPVQISPELTPSTSPSSIKVTPSMPPPIDISPTGNNNNNNNNDTPVATSVEDPSGTAEIPGVVTVSFTSQDFDASESNPILTVNLSSDFIINQASNSIQQTEVVSTAVNILLFGATLSNSIEICFPQGDTSKKDSCLGYIDETQSPPVWKCEDRCLKSKKENLCGKTKHLTNFALLLGGMAKGGDCSDNYGYVLGTSDNDIALVLSVAGFVVLIAIIICLLFSFTPLRKVLYGPEGARVYALRKRQSSLQSVAVSLPSSAPDIA